MLSRGILVIIIFLIPFKALFGQDSKLLILEKIGSKHRITYQVGDPIILRLIGEDFEIRDEITDITDSTIILSTFPVHLNSIYYIKTKHTKGFLSPSNGPKLIIAGLTLFAIDILNQTVVQDGSYEFTSGIAIASASLVAAGGILMIFKYRKFKPGKRKRIRTFVMYRKFSCNFEVYTD
jgi:hypothetical protein